MKVMRILFIYLILAGCSNRVAYESINAGNRSECIKQPPAQYDECMKYANKSYDEYERERKEAIDH